MNSGLSNSLTAAIKAEAMRLGFFACGIAKAGKVDADFATYYLKQVEAHNYADMSYMYEHVEMRLDPRLLMPQAQSVICVALNYAPSSRIADGELQVASYALGQDYHDIVKRKLHQLAAFIYQGAAAPTPIHHPTPATQHPSPATQHPSPTTPRYRACCDTAPILERYWAQQAGLGWIGRNRQLIIPHAGSLFFLGELLVDIDLEYDSPMPNRCGKCRSCIDSCPTHALCPSADAAQPQFSTLDAGRCLSYQTIENRGELSAEAKAKMGNNIYGCDKCQLACPWNRFQQPTSVPEFEPKPELLNMKRADWLQLSEERYRQLFKGSAVKRAKYKGLMRNIRAALASERQPQTKPSWNEKND
ncbi:tRNA epoxyqueuosine(34) reductase QueG [Prevotella sp. kh1p2]|uniref:tRNA epoxyqueuosine(34) reductase QueG n=1 Tax=Prevotella sp. kh1p2 TaxID=1761883 RepID=UPI000B8380AD|nr:tRNA epoxyqueuosine(34) reductase QueG [Prevotella sp. kh1p2]